MPHASAGDLSLNRRARRLVEDAIERCRELRIDVRALPGGGRAIDCGVESRGGLEAGLLLARVCLADLAQVSICPGEVAGAPLPWVQVFTDQPLRACLASQYAGREVRAGSFFAMGSGPMRAAWSGEPILESVFESRGALERPDCLVGVLESRGLPGAEVFDLLEQKTGVPRANIDLLAAPTASVAGGLQVAARSVETALHKLHELGFDVARIESDLEAIGRTNDAILYGGRVVLWVRGDDAAIDAIGPRVPSSSSRDHGVPFLEVFERYQGDFYKIDPMLFSPAELVFQNLESGQSHRFGGLSPQLLARSFFGDKH
jgi:methenyltetrahydromethanopterin cyclohydrolase